MDPNERAQVLAHEAQIFADDLFARRWAVELLTRTRVFGSVKTLYDDADFLIAYIRTGVHPPLSPNVGD